MDKAVDNLNVEDVEVEMFKNLRNFLLKNLDVSSDGTIKPSLKNLRKVQESKSIKNILLTEKYEDSVNGFVDTFDKVADMNKDYLDAELR